MDRAGTATVAYYAVNGREASVRAMAEEHLKVLGLLDPECKHQGLEDAARNYMQIKMGLQNNAVVEEKMIADLKFENDALSEANQGLRDALKTMCADQDALLQKYDKMREMLVHLDQRGGLGNATHDQIRAVIETSAYLPVVGQP